MLPLILVTITLTASTFTSQVLAANHAQSLCEFVAADEKKRMRSYLRNNKIKIRKIFKDLECNDMNLLVFAANKKSGARGSFMISKLPKKIVAAYLALMLEAPAAWLSAAKKRTGGCYGYTSHNTA